MDDLELVQRCTAQDKLAWNQFLQKFSRLIYSAIYNVLKIKGLTVEENTAEELFQELFLFLVRDNFSKLKSFRAKNGCSLATWLKQVAINFTIDYARKYRPLVSLDEGSEDGFSLNDTIADDSAASSDIMEDQEKLAHLKDCITRLNQQEQLFLELHVNHDVGLEDIGRILAVSRSAIDMRKTRLLQRLRQCFRNKGLLLDF